MNTDLKVTTSVLNLNGSGHQNENLAWFWSMDIPRDTQVDDWMSEYRDFLPDLCFILIHHPSLSDQLAVGEGSMRLLGRGGGIDHLQMGVDSELFSKRIGPMAEIAPCQCRDGLTGHACYATRQAETYVRFQDQCHKQWERAIKI